MCFNRHKHQETEESQRRRLVDKSRTVAAVTREGERGEEEIYQEETRLRNAMCAHVRVKLQNTSLFTALQHPLVDRTVSPKG